MGQNSSSSFQNSSQPVFSRRKANSTPAPQLSLPDRMPAPKSPTYAVAENMVIPNGTIDISSARNHLRRVSKELAKYHPEYADIFGHTNNTDSQTGENTDERLNSSIIDKENSIEILNSPMRSRKLTRTPSQETNHSLKSSPSNESALSSSKFNKIESSEINSAQREHSVLDTTNTFQAQNSTINLMRSHSTSTGLMQQVKIPKHKRQTSLTSTTSIQESVILEDPREHLYNAARIMPFSNYQPSTTSLPVKSSFEIDYSLNLTYAQLAEYRRKNRLSELEERTGRKLDELEAEISASSTLPKSPFDLQNLGGRMSTHSNSTSSSDTGVSKSKKKRAPAPPTPQPSDNHQNTPSPGISAQSHEYHMSGKSFLNPQLRGRSLQRSVSSASRSSKPPAPQPVPKSASSCSFLGSESSIFHPQTETSSLPTSSATLPRETSNKNKNTKAPTVPIGSGSYTREVQHSLAEAKAQLEALNKLQEMLSRQKPTESITVDTNETPSNKSARMSDNNIHATYVETAHDDNGNAVHKRGTSDLIKQSEINGQEINSSGVYQTNVHQIEDNRREVHPVVVPQTIGDSQEVRQTSVYLQHGHHIDVQQKVDHHLDVHQRVMQHTEAPHEKVHNKSVNQPDMRQPQVQPPRIDDTDSHQTHITAIDKHPTQMIDKTNNIVSVEDNESPKKMSRLLQHDIILAARDMWVRTAPIVPNSTIANSRTASEVSQKEISSSNNLITTQQEKLKSYRSNEDTINNLDKLHTSDNRNLIFQSDSTKVMKQSARSKPDIQPPIAFPNQNENCKLPKENPKSFISGWKMDNKLSQLDDELDQEDRSSSASMNFSKRSSIHSEDMSISSSSTSHRVFSPDWAPEHDLDSDDDIMDEQNANPDRGVSSGGFKSSIIPPNVSDLKESTTNKSRKKNKKRNENIESAISSSEEKTKFGSIRKFRNSLHKGMLNAFGSISKASGGLLNKQKSHDDNSKNNEGTFKTHAVPEDDELEIVINSNWSLSNSRNGTLRRAVSDSIVSQPHEKKIVDDVILNNSEDEIGDIDFAGGINDIPKLRKNSTQTALSEQNAKVLKSPGIGQTNIFPEYHPVRIEGKGRTVDGNLESEEQGSRTFKKKNKRFSFGSTLRLQEKQRIEELLEKMIYEKEQQYEIERLRQKEMESYFRILRDFEAHERLQNLQKDNSHEVTTTLSQEQLSQRVHNELNNSTVSLSPLNNLVNVQSLPDTKTSYPNTNHPYPNTNHLSLAPYITNSNAAVLQTGYIDSSILNGQIQSLGHHQPNALSHFPTVILGHHLSQTDMQYSHTQPVSFPPHLANFTGSNFISGGLTSKGVTNLAPQELAYLSDYMRMVGVPPPANDQQWAALLSTVNNNIYGNPFVSQIQGQWAHPASGNGPELSNIFGTKIPTVNDIANQQVIQQRELASPQGQNVAFRLSQHPILPDGQSADQQLPLNITSSTKIGGPEAETPNLSSNLTLQESSRTIIPRSALNIQTSDQKYTISGETINYLPSSASTTSTTTDSSTENNKNLPAQDNIPVQNSSKSHYLSAKVYGPIGFRPVSFNPGSPR